MYLHKDNTFSEEKVVVFLEVQSNLLSVPMYIVSCFVSQECPVTDQAEW